VEHADSVGSSKESVITPFQSIFCDPTCTVIFDSSCVQVKIMAVELLYERETSEIIHIKKIHVYYEVQQ
jgi:hypothetical protein